MKKKIYLLLIFIIMVSLIFSGCNSMEKQQIKEVDSIKQEIVVAATSDTLIDQLDAASYNGSMEAYQLIYEGLVDYGHKGEIIPKVAETWEISEDGKVYTFKIRKNIKFSDGSPCNAKAVKFSIERWAGKEEHSWLKVSLGYEKIEVVDENTIKIYFNKKYHRTLEELSFPRPVRIMSPNSVEPAGDPNGKFVKAIGTGPWMIKNYIKDQETVLVPNTYYWGQKPHIQELTLKLVPDVQTRMMALQSGEIDIAGGQISSVAVDNLKTLENDKNLNIKTVPSTTSYFFVCNMENEILKDKQVRKAIGYAIDKENIANNLFNGIGNPAKGLFQFTVPFVTEQNNKGYDYDIELAKQTLENAGWKDSDGDGIIDKNGQPLKFSITLQIEEFGEWKPLCEAVQYNLQNAGMDVSLKVLEKGAYYDALWTTRDFDMFIYRTYSDAWNPLSFLTSLFYLKDEGKAVAFGTPKLNTLIDSVSEAENKQDRQKIYDSIFEYMYSEAACIPVYYPDEIFVFNSRIDNIEFGPTTYNPIKWGELKVIKEK